MQYQAQNSYEKSNYQIAAVLSEPRRESAKTQNSLKNSISFYVVYTLS